MNAGNTEAVGLPGLSPVTVMKVKKAVKSLNKLKAKAKKAMKATKKKANTHSKGKRKANTKAKVRTKAKAVAATNKCACLCGELCRKRFKQGHDPRFYGYIRRIAEGRIDEKPTIPLAIRNAYTVGKAREEYNAHWAKRIRKAA